jgi:hypothetical protein
MPGDKVRTGAGSMTSDWEIQPGKSVVLEVNDIQICQNPRSLFTPASPLLPVTLFHNTFA